VRPNVRTYTALVTALGNGGQWARALDTLGAMRREGPGGHVEPNAYTYSALLKAMGEQGECALAEQVFGQLEAEALAAAALGGEQGAGLQTADPAAWEAAEGRGDDAGDAGGAAPAPVPGYPAGPLPGFEAGPRLDLGFNHFLSAWGPIVTPASGLEVGQARRAERGGPEAEPGVERAGSYSAMPMLLAEQVLASSSPSSASTSDACALPDDLPGQVNGADAAAAAAAAARGLSAAAEPFSFFSAPVGGAAEAGAAAPQRCAPARLTARPGEAAAWAGRGPPRAAKGLVNEVVCGAMMLAYERTGRWAQALGMLERAERLGLSPNTVMLNTALSALAKAGRAADAAALFARIPAPDAASFETLIAAHGLAADPPAAEAVFAALLAAGWPPRDYAYTGLIAAYSLAGDVRGALGVRGRMRMAGVSPSVHVFNALIAAAERAGLWERGLELGRELAAARVEPNAVTRQLLGAIGRGGAALVGDAHLAVTALTAAVAAAGSLAMRSGLF